MNTYVNSFNSSRGGQFIPMNELEFDRITNPRGIGLGQLLGRIPFFAGAVGLICTSPRVFSLILGLLSGDEYKVSVIALLVFAASTAALVVGIKSLKSSRNLSEMKEDLHKIGAVPIPGKIKAILQVDYYDTKKNKITGTVWKMFVEYCRPGETVPRVDEYASFRQNILEYFKTEYISLYFMKNGTDYVVGDYAFRQYPSDPVAKIQYDTVREDIEHNTAE